jgi:hypothetical protein
MIISANKWEHDVQGYLNICNITDTTPRKQIRDFAAGVNDLGLWNSMVCWPLRSTQNAGTGTTAYSLGGLGTFNGTLVNGPTWGVDGVKFSSANHHILLSSISVDPNWKPFSTFAVTDSNFTTNFLAQTTLCSLGSNTTNGALVSVNQSTTNFLGEVGVNRLTGGFRAVSLAYSKGAFGFYFAGFSDYSAPQTMNAFLEFNSTRTTSLFGSGTSPQTETGSVSFLFGGIGASGRDETAAVQAWFNAYLSVEQSAAIRALYKTTLGTGLGLP